jgi:two-component system, OmpR family, phosphate regulon sensor histidine kinase PhoR
MFWRLFGAFGLLLLAAIGGLGAVVLNRVERNYEKQLQERLRTKVFLVREIVRAHEDQSLPELEASLKRLRAERLPRVTLIDQSGKVLLDTDVDAANMDNHGDRSEIVEAGQNGFGSSTRSSYSLAQTFGYAAVRIEPTRQGVRFVRIAVETDSIVDELANLRSLVWTTAAVTGVLAMVLAFWLARRITVPIQELTEGAESIASGNYGHKVYVSGADELRTLARAFNHMSERLGSQFAELDEERQQLRAILSGMIEGVVALDAEQRILFANERALALLDLSGHAVIGRKMWEVIRQRGLTELVRKAMVEPEPCREELAWSGVASRSLTAHAARLQGNVARGAVLVLHDTTELRRLEQLRQEFVANVSHELKTPLSVIQVCAETLQDGAADDPQNRGRFLNRICDEGNRLHSLILDLLSLARIESGAEAFACLSIALDEAVTACLERHCARAASKGQRLEMESDGHIRTFNGEDAVAAPNGSPGPPVVAWADEEAMDQILDNLVDNAMKYTPEGGRIRVRWYTKDGQACLEVEDTGIGIPERDLPRIFERFYRVDKARSRELGGTGLGLSIVKHLVQGMHGTVRASSVLGQGSVFHVCLPRGPQT